MERGTRTGTVANCLLPVNYQQSRNLGSIFSLSVPWAGWVRFDHLQYDGFDNVKIKICNKSWNESIDIIQIVWHALMVARRDQTHATEILSNQMYARLDVQALSLISAVLGLDQPGDLRISVKHSIVSMTRSCRSCSVVYWIRYELGCSLERISERTSGYGVWSLRADSISSWWNL